MKFVRNKNNYFIKKLKKLFYIIDITILGVENELEIGNMFGSVNLTLFNCLKNIKEPRTYKDVVNYFEY